MNHSARLLFAVALALSACSDGNKATDSGVPDGGAAGPCAGRPCMLSLLAGKLDGKGLRDGPGGQARFWGVSAIAGDGQQLYVADTQNVRIRRVALNPIEVTTIAGQAGPSDPFVPRDGPSAQAGFVKPQALALIGQSLFIGDGEFLRRLDLGSMQVTTIKNSVGQPWGITEINDLATDGTRLFIGGIHVIWAYDPSKPDPPAMFAGDFSKDPASIDGDAKTGRFFSVQALAAGGGSLYVGDYCLVRRVDLATGAVSTIAGQRLNEACFQGHTDAKGEAAQLYSLQRMAYDGTYLYATEEPESGSAQVDLAAHGFGTVRRITPATGEVSTVIGYVPPATTVLGEADGPADKARLYHPRGLWVDKTVYVGTPAAVRKLVGSETMTIAGVILDDPFIDPSAIVTDGKHVQLLLDSRRELLRVPVGGGAPETLAQYDWISFPIDGATGLARIGDRLFVAAAPVGILVRDLAQLKSSRLLDKFPYVSESGGLTTDGTSLFYLATIQETSRQHVVMKIDPAKPAGHTSIPASQVGGNLDVVFAQGSLYIADTTVVARLDLATGSVTTLAGKRGTPGCQDGGAQDATFKRAAGIATDGKQLYVGDLGCHAVRAVDLGSGAVSTVLGDPAGAGWIKEGVGSQASLNAPRHLAYDAASANIYVSDPAEDVVLRLGPTPTR